MSILAGIRYGIPEGWTKARISSGNHYTRTEDYDNYVDDLVAVVNAVRRAHSANSAYTTRSLLTSCFPFQSDGSYEEKTLQSARGSIWFIDRQIRDG